MNEIRRNLFNLSGNIAYNISHCAKSIVSVSVDNETGKILKFETIPANDTGVILDDLPCHEQMIHIYGEICGVISERCISGRGLYWTDLEGFDEALSLERDYPQFVNAFSNVSKSLKDDGPQDSFLKIWSECIEIVRSRWVIIDKIAAHLKAEGEANQQQLEAWAEEACRIPDTPYFSMQAH